MADDSPAASSTGPGLDAPELSGMRLTDTQRAILVALCRSRAGGNRYATPATNQEIAGEVFLSVDAVKAHLRALYRKFGVEPLPHNQKRARLVELVMEGGLISPPEDGGAGEELTGQTVAPSEEAAEAPPPPVPGREPAPAPETDGEPSPPKAPRPKRRLIAAGLAAAGALVLALFLTGAISGDSSGGSAEEASTPAAYRAAVNGYCRLALDGQSEQAPNSRAERARGYLGVIETMSGRLESLPPPPADNRDLALFRNGLARAADYTDLIAQGPPAPGSRESANAVAELTLAAGQVQAGALGYRLSRDCSAIGSLVIAGSARNAAVSP